MPDLYTIEAMTTLTGITGFRLEALFDTSLPLGGPGRANNGNFVLTEFTVDAAPVPEPAACASLSVLGLAGFAAWRRRSAAR